MKIIKKYKVTLEPIIEHIEIEVEKAECCCDEYCDVCFWEYTDEAREEFRNNIDDYIENANIVVEADTPKEPIGTENGLPLRENPREIRLEIQKENRESFFIPWVQNHRH